MSLAGRFAAAFDDLLQQDVPRKLGVAVSGGGDSMALMTLVHGWAAARGCLLFVATVDHGLRAAAADEAAMVGDAARALGLRHDILRWQDWDGSGNLQAEARAARYHLLGEWAARHDLDAVALGHTADDVAETFLMRLARGSGVDGLAAMRGTTKRDDVVWLRPLLEFSREDLRAFLRSEQIGWADDPSNDDSRFDRVKARQLLGGLAELGITRDRLGGTARMMGEARTALNWAAAQLADKAAVQQGGDVVLDLAACGVAPRETRLRLISGALRFVASAPYRPRLSQLEDALAAVAAGEVRQLHGCHLIPEAGVLRICREARAVNDEVCGIGGVWDGRWQVIGPDVEGGETRKLGDGLGACPKWRETGLARASLEASPAIWWGETLISAPLAGFAAGYSAHLVPERTNFREFLMTH
ncbi:tRNA lysidine(34) synthetase TilS [Rhodobacteraceae bacterium LMO-12]|nr:tRNA lysidine(34) synthetase TilS [Rhodobacteraceae bacterium LMO-JJ12]